MMQQSLGGCFQGRRVACLSGTHFSFLDVVWCGVWCVRAFSCSHTPANATTNDAQPAASGCRALHIHEESRTDAIPNIYLYYATQVTQHIQA